MHKRESWSFIWTGYQHHCCYFFPAQRATESFYKYSEMFSASSVALFGNFLSLLKIASGSFSPDRLYLNRRKNNQKKHSNHPCPSFEFLSSQTFKYTLEKVVAFKVRFALSSHAVKKIWKIFTSGLTKLHPLMRSVRYTHNWLVILPCFLIRIMSTSPFYGFSQYFPNV